MPAKRTYVKKLEAMLEARQKVEGEQPLDCLVSIYQNKNNRIDMRLAAATAAAPYVHRKMPVAVEVGGSAGVPLAITMNVVGPKRG